MKKPIEKEKPEILECLPGFIPHDLKRYPHFVLWGLRYSDKHKKWTKPPYSARTLRLADKTKKSDCVDYETAVSVLNSNNGKFAGIGFATLIADPFVFIDLDKCRNPKTGELTSDAKKILNRLNTYTEISPSGTGIRAIVKGKLPSNGRKKGNFEVYDKDAYLTLTGQVLPSYPSVINSRQAEIEWYHRNYIQPKKKQGKDRSSKKHEVQQTSKIPQSDYPGYLEAFVWNTTGFPDIQYLWKGNFTHKYPSQSEADLALANILRDWIGPDIGLIDYCFRKSGLMRDKWDRKHFSDGSTYGRATIKKVLEGYSLGYDPNKPSILDFLYQNEVGDSALFIKQYRDKFIFDHSVGIWHIYRGPHWVEDQKKSALTAVQSVVTDYQTGLAKLREDADKKTVNALQQRILGLQTLLRRKRVLELAAAGEEGLSLAGDEWDLHPLLLPVKNGVVDLKSGKLLPGTPDLYLKTVAPIAYDPDATPPVEFLKFLNVLFDDDAEIVTFIKQLFGLSLIGEYREPIFPVFYGPSGQNGKATLLETVVDILGPMAGSIRSEILLEKKLPANPNSHNAEEMSVRGKRLIHTSEENKDTKFDASRVKFLTGGDRVKGRGAYGKRPQEFYPSHTLFFITNYIPKADAHDSAFWERVKVIPFKYSFLQPDSFDPDNPYHKPVVRRFKDRLLKEAPGILKFMVEGAVEYLKAGKLKIPVKVQIATNEARGDDGGFWGFVADAFVRVRGSWIPASKTYETYQVWFRHHYGPDARILPSSDFGQFLKKEFEYHRGGKKGRRYENVEFKAAMIDFCNKCNAKTQHQHKPQVDIINLFKD